MKNQIASVCFTGHRPNKLYGYGSYENWRPLFDTIYSLCEKLYTEHGTRTFITGGAQGVDQTAFWAIRKLARSHPDINNIVYVPMKGQELRWREDGIFNQKDFRKMLNLASNYQILTDTPSIKALFDRNERMVNDTDAVIAVWNGDMKSGTAACIKYARKINRKVIRIDPLSLATDISEVSL